jgi:hypothetical protein
MMSKRFLAAALMGMLTIAIVGGALYGVAFASFFRANLVSPGVMKNPPSLVWIGLSHIPFGVLLALVVSWRGVLTPRGGAITGATLGFLMATSYDFAQYGTSSLWTLRLTLIEPFITMIMVAAAGAVVATVLARGRVAT